jgi:hypothetical protein
MGITRQGVDNALRKAKEKMLAALKARGLSGVENGVLYSRKDSANASEMPEDNRAAQSQSGQPSPSGRTAKDGAPKGYSRVIKTIPKKYDARPIKDGDWVSLDEQTGWDYQAAYAGEKWRETDHIITAFVRDSALHDMQTGFGSGQTLKIESSADDDILPPESSASNSGALNSRTDTETTFSDIPTNPERVPTWLSEDAEGDPMSPIDVSERKRKGRLVAIAWESAADVLERQKNPTALKLSKAIHDKANYEAEIEARLALPVENALETMPDRKTRKTAKDEFEQYQMTKGSRGKPAAEELLQGFSEAGKELVRAYQQVAAASGSFAQRQNVQVWDQAENGGKGGYRQIRNLGGDYWPRVIKQDLLKAIANPDKHRKVIEAYSEALAAEGWTEAQIKDFFQGTAPALLNRSDFFGQLEMARTAKLPSIFYEYGFDKVFPGFVRGYADRMAQIMAYGQKLKRDPNSKDLFEEAIEESVNAETREFIQEIQKQAYRISERTAWNRFTQSVRTLASGLLLANPLTTVPRNVISGLLANVEAGGLLRTFKAFSQVVSGQVSQMTAKQLGTVKANVLDSQDYQDPELSAADWVRRFSNFTLGASGYNASERFVRTIATATAMQYVTDYLHAAPNSKTAQEAEAFMGRVGVDPRKIRVEDGDFKQGRESRTLIRRFVKDSQFGYDVSQVPLWANSPVGRLFYQFGRWGTQRARTLWKHVFEPAIFGELVGEPGKRYKVRNMKPLATVLTATMARGVAVGATAVLTGEVFAAIAQAAFKRDRDDEDWSVIMERLSQNDEGAMKSLMERLANDVMMGGMLGILSQPADLAKSWVQGSRFKNPIEPPATSVPKAVFEVLRSWYERGMPSSFDDGTAGIGKDLWMSLRSVMPGVGAVSDAVGRMGSLVAKQTDYFGSADATRTLANLRKATRRFANESGLEAGGIEGRFAKKPQTASLDRMQDALLRGDAEDAGKVLNEYLDRFGKDDPGRALKSMKASMRARQPIKVGSHSSEDVREEFIDWARKHLSADRLREIEEIQDRYNDTAAAVGLR